MTARRIRVSFEEHFKTYSNFKHVLNRDGGSFKKFARRNCKSLRQLYQNDFALPDSAGDVSHNGGIIAKKPTQVREQYAEPKAILNLDKQHYAVKHPIEAHKVSTRCIL